jgi:Flp pilus assembly protein TadG
MKTRWRRVSQAFSRLLADRQGSSVLEFAIVYPFMMILFFGTIELALDMIVDASVEIAAQAASRVGLTTTAPATGTRASQASAIVNQILGGWEKLGANVSITELDYGTYANITTPGFTAAAGEGALGDVVSYNIKVTIPGFTGIPELFGAPTLTFQRNYLVQNEQ